MKQKTLQFALEWSSRMQEFQIGRQSIPSTGCSNRESPVIRLPTRSWYNQVTVICWMQQRPWRNVRGGHQCNQERARWAGRACTVLFCMWLATNAAPAKPEWHGRKDLLRSI